MHVPSEAELIRLRRLARMQAVREASMRAPKALLELSSKAAKGSHATCGCLAEARPLRAS